MDSSEIKKIRQSKGLSQKEFADLVGFAQNTISEIETGKRKISKSLEIIIAERFKEKQKQILPDLTLEEIANMVAWIRKKMEEEKMP